MLLLRRACLLASVLVLAVLATGTRAQVPYVDDFAPRQAWHQDTGISLTLVGGNFTTATGFPRCGLLLPTTGFVSYEAASRSDATVICNIPAVAAADIGFANVSVSNDGITYYDAVDQQQFEFVANITCGPGCANGGVCVNLNECECTEAFFGIYCTEQVLPSPEDIPLPFALSQEVVLVISIVGGLLLGVAAGMLVYRVVNPRGFEEFLSMASSKSNKSNNSNA